MVSFVRERASESHATCDTSARIYSTGSAGGDSSSPLAADKILADLVESGNGRREGGSKGCLMRNIYERELALEFLLVISNTLSPRSLPCHPAYDIVKTPRKPISTGTCVQLGRTLNLSRVDPGAAPKVKTSTKL